MSILLILIIIFIIIILYKKPKKKTFLISDEATLPIIEVEDHDEHEGSSLYNDPRWNEKKESIKQRDHYTCQRCGIFDPSKDNYIIEKREQGYIELHQYDKYKSRYTFTTNKISNHSLNPFIYKTIHIDFDNVKLVMPTLNVHHLFYINNHKSWEYDDEALITLCQECHRNLHKKECIPVYKIKKAPQNLIKYYQVKLNPLSFDKRKVSSFTPWKFVTKINDEYEYVPHIQAKITWVHVDNLDHNCLENDKKRIENIYFEFVNKYLPNYK